MRKNDEFYVGYVEDVGPNTKRVLKRFVVSAMLVMALAAFIFSWTQHPFRNSTFELTEATELIGVYHESPYPMLRISTGQGTYKNVVLLGFGKSGVYPFLEQVRQETERLQNKSLKISGNLIYYNGKTLLQITDANEVQVLGEASHSMNSVRTSLGIQTFQGEIVDPKCYFGVMKPGRGKIHRSCAVRCISGGIPPVLSTTDANGFSKYLLITDAEGLPIHEAILPYVGQPAELTGDLEVLDDWYVLKIRPESIKKTQKASSVYE